MVEVSLPGWLAFLRPVAARIQEAGSFRGAVIAIVAGWLVGGILDIGRTLVGVVQLAFSPILDAIGIVADSLTSAFAPAGAAILGFWTTVNTAVANVAGVAGPAAPLITVGIFVVVGYLVYRLAISVAGEFPVLSTAVDFLGLRP